MKKKKVRAYIENYYVVSYNVQFSNVRKPIYYQQKKRSWLGSIKEINLSIVVER